MQICAFKQVKPRMCQFTCGRILLGWRGLELQQEVALPSTPFPYSSGLCSLLFLVMEWGGLGLFAIVASFLRAVLQGDSWKRQNDKARPSFPVFHCRAQ